MAAISARERHRRLHERLNALRPYGLICSRRSCDGGLICATARFADDPDPDAHGSVVCRDEYQIDWFVGPWIEHYEWMSDGVPFDSAEAVVESARRLRAGCQRVWDWIAVGSPVPPLPEVPRLVPSGLEYHAQWYQYSKAADHHLDAATGCRVAFDPAGHAYHGRAALACARAAAAGAPDTSRVFCLWRAVVLAKRHGTPSDQAALLAELLRAQPDDGILTELRRQGVAV